ncbi:hypothetical protein HID58_050639 [Brassica napus]|uniref:AIG1-type G domain-containing protein n=2 Tax=Brassica TaxID=3705 RepID=A0ABQ8A6Q0_BRANA|nr:translocase of chloroplast 120, chloroplastic-like [Brassica napus]KAH0888210.1 hypothetical protein HID58_050639 [Brassica napus]
MEEKKNADDDRIINDNILMISDVHADDEDFEKQQEGSSRLNISREIQESVRKSEEASCVSPTSSLPPAPPVLGLGRGAPPLKPTPRRRVNGNVSQHPTTTTTAETDETRVKFLRLSHRLGQTPRNNVVVAQFLYRLGLPELSRGSSRGVGAFISSINRAISMAEQLEGQKQDHPLDFSCTIMLLGKSGVGKSATINSIFDDDHQVKKMCTTDAFQMGTKRVQLVEGFVQGIKVRVIDTPGLSPSWFDQHKNVKTLKSIRAFIKKSPPDVVLYLDRLDTQTQSIDDDMLLLRTITHVLGPSIWSNAIVGLTHAASAPPDGAASSYDMFVTRRCHAIQLDIRQAAGDVRLNPVSLVENHPACRTNRAGQRVLPNGQAWKPHLLLLSFASKILAQENAYDVNYNSPPLVVEARSKAQPPLSLFLSSLLESDQLPPPFKRLTEAEISRLSEQYRVEFEHQAELEMEEENERRRPHITLPPTMPVPIPIWYDTNNHPVRTHPPIDLSNPSLLVTPVLVLPGWDHDIGYDGLSAEGTLVNVKEKIHMSYSGQATENFMKKGANVQLEMASLVVHGEEGNRSTSLGFEMQKKTWDELSCTLRSDSNFMKHKAAAGLAVTLLGDSVSAGMKAERKLIANKRFGMDVCGGGAMTCRGDAAYGGSLEAQLLGRFFLSTLGLSVVDGHGGLAIGGNIQTQVHIGRSSDLTARANLNSRGAVQVSIRANIFEQLEHAMAALVPLFKKLLSYYSPN